MNYVIMQACKYGAYLYSAIYLKMLNEVTSAHRPSLMTWITHEMFGFFEVNGDATDASESDNEIPQWARFNAPQSFAPSPHIPEEKRLIRNKVSERLKSFETFLLKRFEK